MVFDGKWIDRISTTFRDVSDPCFKKQDELYINKRIYTAEYVVLPVLNKEGKLSAGV